MIVDPKYIYGSLTFSVPGARSLTLVDDTTKTVSTRCSWADQNVPPVWDRETRHWYSYRIEPFPESHHID